MKELVDFCLKFISLETTKDKFKEFQKAVELIKNIIPKEYIKVFIYRKIPIVFIFNKRESEFKKKNKYYFDILLQGHLDVVEGDKSLFKPVIKNRFIYGRGAVDMKCACVIMIFIMKELIKRNIDKKVGLMITFDEEIGGQSAESMKNKIFGDILINLDGGYGLDLTYGERGFIIFELSCEAKKPISTVKLWQFKQTPDPIQKISFDISNLSKEFNKGVGIEKTAFGVRSFSAEEFKGDLRSIYKIVRAKCIVSFLNNQPQEILARIKKRVKFSKLKILLNVEPVKPQNLQDRRLIMFKKLLSKYSKRKALNQIDSGSSDARFFQNNFNLILMSRVAGDGAHSANERAEINKLVPLYKALLDFIILS